MKTTTFISSCVRFGLLAAALSLANLATAQWVAFNDHVDGPGTHPNATRFVIPIIAGTSNGFLKDINTGANLPVTLTISINTNQGVAISSGNTAGLPGVGTPAYNVFNGFVDFGTTNRTGNAVQTPLNTLVTYTFTGLDVTKQYKFHGSAVRGGNASNYTNRWEIYSIVGASSFVNVPTPGCVTTVQEPTDIAANQVVFDAGTNTNAPPAAGEMAEWDNIVPGAGGTFSVTCTRYAGALPAPNSATLNTPPYSYALTGIRLEEVNVVPACAAITQAPTNQTVAQCSTVTMHVSATGNPPPSYQWFKGANSILNATNANYSITNAQPSDSGVYHVTVSNTAAGCTATNATNTLTVTPTPAMTVVSATGSATNLSHIVISYSAPIDATSVDPNGFSFHLTGGLNPASAAVANGTNVLLVTDAPRAQGVDYCMTIDAGSASSVCGSSPAAAKTMQIGAWYVFALGTADAGWTYNDSGVAPPANWIQRSFDDTAAPWQAGTGVFDMKNAGPRLGAFGDFIVNTALVLTNHSGPFGTNDIPTYNFRKHFNFPAISGVRLLMNATIDDAAIFYINGQEAARVGGLTNGVAIPFAEYGGANTNGHGYGSRTVGTASNWTDVSVSLPLTNVVFGGDNVLAVELKQERNTSSDITMGLELLVVSGTPRVTIGRSGTNDVVSWCTGTLQASTNPAAFFSDVANAVSPLTVTNTGPRKFFRLR